MQRICIYIFSCTSGTEDYCMYHFSYYYYSGSFLYHDCSNRRWNLCGNSFRCKDYLLLPGMFRKSKGSTNRKLFWIPEIIVYCRNKNGRDCKTVFAVFLIESYFYEESVIVKRREFPSSLRAVIFPLCAFAIA